MLHRLHEHCGQDGPPILRWFRKLMRIYTSWSSCIYWTTRKRWMPSNALVKKENLLLELIIFMRHSNWVEIWLIFCHIFRASHAKAKKPQSSVSGFDRCPVLLLLLSSIWIRQQVWSNSAFLARKASDCNFEERLWRTGCSHKLSVTELPALQFVWSGSLRIFNY